MARQRSIYEVTVGNVGTVSTGNNRKDAEKVYNSYLIMEAPGRAKDETVVLMVNGEPEREAIVGSGFPVLGKPLRSRLEREDDIHVLWNLTDWTEEKEELTIEVWNGVGELKCRAFLTLPGRIKGVHEEVIEEAEKEIVRVFALMFCQVEGCEFGMWQIDTLD